jgi:hypothetical protein
MAEDFEEFEAEEPSSSGTSRPFLLLAGLLLLTLIACLAATALVASNRTADGQEDEVASIVATNEAISTQNAFVTQTVAAMATEDARPTNTPEPTSTTPPTNTPQPSNTPAPTDTPVVAGEAAETEEAANGEGVPGDATATPDFTGAGNAGDNGGFPTPTPDFQDTTTLPDTGIGIWGAFGLALAFLVILLLARQVRGSL